MYIEAVDLVSISDDDEATVRIKMYDGSERERKLDQDEYFLSELDAYEALFGILTEDIYVVEYRIQCLRDGRPYTWQPPRDED